MTGDAPVPIRCDHIFTVDVEDYFQVGAFERSLPRGHWDAQPRRINPAMDRLLEALGRHDQTATFFCLGWIADRYPLLIRRIADAGHEVAAHGWWHKSISDLSPAEFRDDVRAAKARLEMESGQQVLGFRAPNFSLVPGTEWVIEVLLEEGYAYDSSILPMRRRHSGYPNARTAPHFLPCPSGRLLEVPVGTLQVFGRPRAALGGNYFRQFPYRLTKLGFEQAEAEGRPAVFYLHPWELDPQQPQVSVPLLTRLRHYRGLRQAPKRLERLLTEYRFTSVVACLLGDEGSRDEGRDSTSLRAASAGRTEEAHGPAGVRAGPAPR